MIYKKLKIDDKERIEEIARIHAKVGAMYSSGYTLSDEDISSNINKINRQLKDKIAFCYIAQENDKMISFLWASKNKNNVIDIWSLWTEEEYRNKGIASHLKIELEKWGRAQKCEKIVTTINCQNKGMIHINKKMDYETRYLLMEKML